MFANGADGGATIDPFVGGLGGIVIIQCTAGGIGAVQSILGSATAAVGDCNRVELAIVQSGKCALLINDAGDGVGKGGAGDPIQDNGAYGDLPAVRFATGFGRYKPCQQIKVT